MYSWKELNPKAGATTTFAYWLLVEKKKLKDAKIDLDALSSWFSYHYDVEEQATSKKRVLSTSEYSKHFRPVSPITLAQEWTPYSLAIDALDAPLINKREETNFHPFTLAVFQSKFLGAWDPKIENEHEDHFAFLLRLAASLAEMNTGRIFLIGSPGWSYDSWKNKFKYMNPDTAICMNQAGYIYTDRIAK